MTHYCRNIFCFLISVCWLACVGIAPAAEAPVLVITDTPETTEHSYDKRSGVILHAMGFFICPKNIMAGDMLVKQVGWLDAAKVLEDLADQKAVILWNAPVGFKDQRGTDPWYRDLDVIPESAARKIVSFVEKGGVLVVAGGEMNYGAGAKEIGSSSSQGKENKRETISYAGSPLASILPVNVSTGYTLQSITNPKDKTRAAVKIVKEDPMIASLDFSRWGFDAYHKVKTIEGAEVLIALDNGDPLVVRARVKKGSVICILAAPRANILVKGMSDPLWPEESVLLDRALQWGWGKPMGDAARETKLLNKYRRLTAPPPALPREVIAQEYPFALHDPSATSGYCDLVLRYCQDLGANTIILQGTTTQPSALEKYLEVFCPSLEQNNLFAFLHPELGHCVRVRGKLDTREYAQVMLPGGEIALWYGNPYACPNSTNTINFAVKDANEWMPVVKNFPAIRGAFYDDEWSWCMAYRNIYEGKAGLACYCTACNAKYKKATGQEAPPPVFREPGYVAPENDPWLKWCQIIREGSYAGYNAAVRDAIKSHRKDFILSNYPGGYDGNLDVIVEEVYLDCRAQSPLETFDRFDVRANGHPPAREGKQPIYALIGMFHFPEDKSMSPQVARLTVGACLAAGFKGIIFWHAQNIWVPYMQSPERGALEPEIKRLGQFVKKFGPMFLELKKSECPVAILSSWFWNSSFHQYQLVPPPGDEKAIKDKECTWWGFQIGEIAVPAAHRAGLQVESVTEKQLLDGSLAKRKVVILPGLIHCREAVVKNLENYIAGGGKVFVDESTKVAIKGAERIPVDFSKWHYDIVDGKRPWVQPTIPSYNFASSNIESRIAETIPALREQILPVANSPYFCETSEAVCALLENGKTKYLAVLNVNMDKANKFKIALTGLPGQVYDIEESKKLSSGSSIEAALPPAGFKFFALSDQVIGSVQVSGTRQNGGLNLKVKVLDVDKNIFSGAVPVAIKLACDNGDVVLYRATNKGELTITLPLEGALKGAKSAEVQELFSGKKSATEKI